MDESGALYLGLDLSTQQLKGLVVNSSLKLIHEERVDFDADLGHYGIEKGVLTNPSQGEVYAPVAMWLEAIDLLMSRLEGAGVLMSNIVGVSGAGMQHGIVMWAEGAEESLRSLDPGKSLVEQLSAAEQSVLDEKEGDDSGYTFSHPHSPNWQDASTQEQCDEFDRQLGDPETLAEVTGSKAHHRFSGPQILRFRKKYPDHYARTSRISLVSSFLASIFLGRIAPIDIGDVCGMNLRSIKDGMWHSSMMCLCAGSPEAAIELEQKLGPVPEDGGSKLGNVSSYFIQRYGFNSHCSIVPFTGDNPATILALPLRPSDAIVSLGTSTTFLMSTPAYRPHPAYHFMNHPTTPGLFMFMLCYKNGGLAREEVRDEINAAAGLNSQSWDLFDETALGTPPLGRRGEDMPMKMGLYFPRPEIVPNVRAGRWRYSCTPGGSMSEGSQGWQLPNDDARAIIESQLLSLRLRSQNLVEAQGSLPPQPRRVYLVGGGSVDPAIVQITAEVLGGVEGVYHLEVGANAYALGAAYKAVWGLNRGPNESFEKFVGDRWDEDSFVKRICEGYREGVWQTYGDAVKGFEIMEGMVSEDEGAR